MKKKVILAVVLVATLCVSSCVDKNTHQFKLDFKSTAILTVRCDNCFYYFNNYDEVPQTNVIERQIDADAIELLSSIKFCGLGDTTPDAQIRIETDIGSVASFGILFPNQDYKSTLRIQSQQTGLGQGCSRKDQERFEKFFDMYASKESL